jgi:hypothetical protein
MRAEDIKFDPERCRVVMVTAETSIGDLRDIKTCKSCKWSEKMAPDYHEMTCCHDVKYETKGFDILLGLEIVSSEGYKNCVDMRHDLNSCGPLAKYWEQWDD